jgi:hypothetical protein
MKKTFYYKQLNIDYNLEEIKNFFLNRTRYSQRFELLNTREALNELPSIEAWFIKQNLEAQTVAYIATAPAFKQVIHTDVGTPTLAINFPVANCENVATRFYKADLSHCVVNNTPETALPYATYPESSVIEVCSYVLRTPVLLNIKEPHSIVNLTTRTRYALSFRFKKDPYHLM